MNFKMSKYTRIGIAGAACVLLLAAGLYVTQHRHFSKNTSGMSKPTTHRLSDAPNIDDSSAWSKMFSDEFSKNTLDHAKWATCYEWYDTHTHGCTNSGNNEQEWYVDQQVSVRDGHAVLTAVSDPITIQKNGAPKTFPYQ